MSVFFSDSATDNHTNNTSDTWKHTIISDRSWNYVTDYLPYK